MKNYEKKSYEKKSYEKKSYEKKSYEKKSYENRVTELERIRRKTIAAMTEYLIYLHREAEQVKEAIQKMDKS